MNWSTAATHGLKHFMLTRGAYNVAQGTSPVYARRLAVKKKAETHGSIYVLRKSYDNPNELTHEFQAESRSDF